MADELVYVAESVKNLLSNKDDRLSMLDSEHLHDSLTGVTFHFYRENRAPFKITKEQQVMISEHDLTTTEHLKFDELMQSFIECYDKQAKANKGELVAMYKRV